MSDIDLDELRAELDDFAAAGEEGRPLAARGADHRRLRGDTAVCRRNTVAPRNTGKIVTFSSGCMPCALTACVRWRSVVRCSRRWIIRGCWPAAETAAAATCQSRWTTMSSRRVGGRGGVSRHHRASPCPHTAERQARSRRSPIAGEVRGLRSLQAAVCSRSEGDLRAACARPALRAEGRDRPGELVHCRRTEGLCRGDGGGYSRTARGRTDARLGE